MSTRTNGGAGYTTVGIDAPDIGRFNAIALEDGDVLVYDRGNEDAWIRTDTPVELDQAA